MDQSSRARRVRPAIFIAVTAAAIAVTVCTKPFPQDPRYHLFVDDRTLLGIRNALDVLSNVGFVLAGVVGLTALRRRDAFIDGRERLPWLVLFAGVLLTSAGSAWYHLAPTNDSLVWDRLPMTLGFMGLLAALVAERVSVRWGVALLAPLVLLGAASVYYWIWTEWQGRGDLRYYYLVQFYPLGAILLLLALYPARYTRGADLVVALAWYVAAKAAESHDGEIYRALGLVSGHTLKHVLATVGALWLARMLLLRRPIAAEAAGSP
jgi:hypothetical protein